MFSVLGSTCSNNVMNDCFTYVSQSKSFQGSVSLYNLSMFSRQSKGATSNAVYNKGAVSNAIYNKFVHLFFENVM